MFQTRHGLWFPLGILIVCSCIGPVCSTKDDDTIGNAFGSLFKAILNVVKSQFEATKDFVPGSDKTDWSQNSTAQNTEGNGTLDRPNSQVNMKVGMESKKVYTKEGSTFAPSTEKDNLVSTENSEMLSEDNKNIKPAIEQGQSVPEKDNHQQETENDLANPTSAALQSSGRKPENGRLTDVSFSDAKSLKQESLTEIGEERGMNSWPYQPDVKEMLVALEQEITEPVGDIESITGGSGEEVDKSGSVHAHNMTNVESPSSESAINETASGDTEPKEKAQNFDFGTESEAPIQEGAELGLGDVVIDNAESSIINASGMTGSTFDENVSGGFDQETSLKELASMEGEEEWPFKQKVDNVIQTVEKELDKHRESLQGQDPLSDLQQSGNAIKEAFTETNSGTEGEQVEKDNLETEAQSEAIPVQADNTKSPKSTESVTDHTAGHSEGTKDTEKSAESDALLRLVNTL